MNVFLRHESECTAQLFCECKFYELDDVCAELRKRGVYHEGGMYYEFLTQFCLDDTSAYAEIVVAGEPG